MSGVMDYEKIILTNKGLVDLDLGAVFQKPAERAALAVVKKMDVSHNKLTKVSGLQTLSSLSHVNLSHNRLQSMRGMPLSICHLDISHNNLASLEPLAALTSLQVLDCSHNRIESLRGVETSGVLHTLKASHNKLTSLAPIASSTSLQHLHVNNNCIREAQELEVFTTCNSLISLFIAGNPITDAYPAYQRCLLGLLPCLKILDGQPVRQAPPAHNKQALSSCLRQGRASSSHHNQVQFEGIPKDDPPQQPHQPRPMRRTPLEESTLRNIIEKSRPLPAPKSLDGSHMVGVVHRKEANKENIGAGHRGHPSSSHRYEAVESGYHSSLHHPPSPTSELKGEVHRLTAKVEELQRLLGKEQDKTAGLDRERRQLQEDLRNANRIISKQLKQLAVLKEENDSLKSDLAGHRERADKLAKEFKYVHSSNNNLRIQLGFKALDERPVQRGREAQGSPSVYKASPRKPVIHSADSAAKLLAVPMPPTITRGVKYTKDHAYGTPRVRSNSGHALRQHQETPSTDRRSKTPPPLAATPSRIPQRQMASMPSSKKQQRKTPSRPLPEGASHPVIVSSESRQHSAMAAAVHSVHADEPDTVPSRGRSGYYTSFQKGGPPLSNNDVAQRLQSLTDLVSNNSSSLMPQQQLSFDTSSAGGSSRPQRSHSASRVQEEGHPGGPGKKMRSRTPPVHSDSATMGWGNSVFNTLSASSADIKTLTRFSPPKR